MHPGQRKVFARGFSLIELMVTVVIVAILAAVAVPSYRQYLIRGNRTAAKAAMADLAAREQQALFNNRGYVTTSQLTDSGYSPDSKATQYYTWSVTVNNGASPPTFQIDFQGKSGTIQASDGGLRLDSQGNKYTLTTGGAVTTSVDHWNQ